MSLSTTTSRITAAASQFLVNWRHLLLFLSLAGSILLASGLSRTSLDTSISVLLGQNDPYVEERDRLRELFVSQQEISFALVPETGEVFDPILLRALQDLQRRYREVPYSSRFSSILNFYSPYGEVSLLPSPWRDFEHFNEQQLHEARIKALQDPLVNGIYISPGADMAMAVITLSLSESSSAQNREISEAVNRLQRELQQLHPRVEIHASSEALFEQSTREAMLSDLSTLLPLVILLCVLFICYCFSSWTLGLSVLSVALLTVILTIGTLGWLNWPFNTISVMAPLVVVIIAVADGVHILSVYKQQLAAGLPTLSAMRNSLAFNLRPVTLATITTAIGFSCLNFASSPAISEFGSIVAIGVIYAWVVTLLIFPAVVLWLSRNYQTGTVTGRSTRLTGGILRLCHWLLRQHPRKLFWSVCVIALISIALLPLNETDFDRMDFISRDSPLHDYYEALNSRMESGPLLSYGVDAGYASGITEPALLRQLDDFSNWLRAQPEIRSVVSLVEVVKTINQTLAETEAAQQDSSGARPSGPTAVRAADDSEVGSSYTIPRSQQQVEQHLQDYLLVQTEAFALRNFVTEDLSVLRLFIETRPLSNQQIIDLDQRISMHFRQQLPAARLLHGSNTLLFARMDESVTLELIHGYALSLLMITLTLMVGLRSVYYGLLSVIPNLLPATIVFGAWGLLVGQIDPFVMMLFSISIGLVVDDTVHVLSTYLRELRVQDLQRQELTESAVAQDEQSTRAVLAAITKAGPALIITTSVLALGSFVLIGASTLYFQQAAQLLVPIVVLALVLDLSFFPLVLQRLDRRRLQRRFAAAAAD